MEPGAQDDKKIFDLVDVLEEKNNKNNNEVIVIDGRGYEKNHKVKTLYDVVNEDNENTQEGKLNEEILQIATEIAERVTREIVPDIAERIIREEIEKLKKSGDS
ncbi:MAG TPA: hypothetical protein ENN23_06175 [Deltaproteobacteria bacterium]|nr:hypothetical protein [Deltaproteobacteria bacterium]